VSFFLPAQSWLLPLQRAWIDDNAILRIWEKSRQIGATKTDETQGWVKQTGIKYLILSACIICPPSLL